MERGREYFPLTPTRRPEASLWGDSGTPDDDRLGISSPQILARVLTVKIGSTDDRTNGLAESGLMAATISAATIA
jgi:hypothetical protein